MKFEAEQQLVAEIKKYITDNLPLSRLSDEELQENVEQIVEERLKGEYVAIEHNGVAAHYELTEGFYDLTRITLLHEDKTS